MIVDGFKDCKLTIYQTRLGRHKTRAIVGVGVRHVVVDIEVERATLIHTLVPVAANIGALTRVRVHIEPKKDHNNVTQLAI